ncbi:MAG: CPBP family intramembrane metalloprotease [Blastocatellia bacterium]|nr:CPBP family intramembrane metalloprotease [Blastocatellia bacterium]
MLSQPLSLAHTLRLLIRLKARKLLNRFQATLIQRKGKKGSSEERTGTGRKADASPLRGAVFGLLVFGYAFSIGWFTVTTLPASIEQHNETKLMVWGKNEPVSPPPIPRFSLSARKETLHSQSFENLISFLVLLWCTASIAFTIGYQNKDIARLDADVEWLLTLPVSVQTIFLSKVLEATLLSLGWMTVFPLYTCALWKWGFRWSALPLALGLTVVCNLVCAVVQVSLELGIRRLLSITWLNTLQAVATLFGTLLNVCVIYFPIWLGTHDWLYQLAQTLGGMGGYLPTSLGIQLWRGETGGKVWMQVSGQVVGLAVMVALGWGMVGWASRRGLEAVQGTFRGSRERGVPQASSRRWLQGILFKDVLLLRRDKTLMAQLFIPFFTMIPMMVIRGSSRSLVDNPKNWSMFAYSFGVMPMFMMTTGALVHEGKALWLLTTFPQPLQRMLLNKVKIWSCIGLTIFFLIWLTGGLVRGHFGSEAYLSGLWGAACLPLGGVLGVAFAILGTDPFAVEKNRRLRGDLVGQAMILIMAMGAGLFIPSWWVKTVYLGIFGFVVFAFWQKAAANVDYLLDPTAAPPPAINLADSMTAVLLFLLGQSLFSALLVTAKGTLVLVISCVGYLLAALITGILGVASIREERIPFKMAFPLWNPAEEALRPALVVTLTGVVWAILTALGWLWYFKTHNLLASMVDLQTSRSTEFASLNPVAAGLVVTIGFLVRPVFEELLYRGLVFQGFCRQWRPSVAAVVTATLSAVLLPPLLGVPVFLLGLVSAWAFNRSGVLLPAIAVNFAFNATVLLLGFGLGIFRL